MLGVLKGYDRSFIPEKLRSGRFSDDLIKNTDLTIEVFADETMLLVTIEYYQIV